MPRSTTAIPAAAALLLLTTAAAPAARAWSAGGHRIVARIAEKRLNWRARAQVALLLATPVPHASGGAADIAGAAVWADEVRDEPDFRETAPLHYIDHPHAADGTPAPGGLPKAENILTGLRRYVAVLRAPGASRTQKAEALRFVLHFVGDLHQPLHCATRVSRSQPDGDDGGNDFKIKAPPGYDADGDAYISLHSLWDRGVGGFPPPSDAAGLIAATTRITAANPAADPAWKAGGAFGYEAWARESLALAKAGVYAGLNRYGTPGPAYLRAGTRLADRRAAWAGYRLAALLNAVYPEPGVARTRRRGTGAGAKRRAPGRHRVTARR